MLGRVVFIDVIEAVYLFLVHVQLDFCPFQIFPIIEVGQRVMDRRRQPRVLPQWKFLIGVGQRVENFIFFSLEQFYVVQIEICMFRSRVMVGARVVHGVWGYGHGFEIILEEILGFGLSQWSGLVFILGVSILMDDLLHVAHHAFDIDIFYNVGGGLVRVLGAGATARKWPE